MDVDVWRLRPDVPHSSRMNENAEAHSTPNLSGDDASASIKTSDDGVIRRETVGEWPREASQLGATLECEGQSGWVFVCQFESETASQTLTTVRLFDAVLFSLGLKRQEVAMISTWPLSGENAPESRSLAAVLDDHCERHKPKVLVVLGNECVSALPGSSEQEGSSRKYYVYEKGKLPLVATHGLDTLLAHPKFKEDTWKTLIQARQIVER